MAGRDSARYRKVIDGVARGDFHRPGALECQRLLELEPQFFAQLSAEVQTLVTRHAPSEVAAETHVTNWTKPFGRAVQFSLLNCSGRFDDTTTDHNLSTRAKRFHHGADYPTIERFVGLFPHAVNMRLNGMSPGGGLSPHEEHVGWRRGRRWYFRARFHLPVATNADCIVMLEGKTYHFAEGSIYFFNNGCVHTAGNRGQTQRYHFVWDMLLTEETVDLMFGDGALTSLIRVLGADRSVTPLRDDPVGQFQISGTGEKLYRRMRLSRLGVQPHAWQSQFTRGRYLLYRLGTPSVAPLQ